MHHPCGQSRWTSSKKRPIPRWSILRRSVSHTRSPVSLLITSRDIQQPSGSSPHNLTSPLYLPLSTYILVDHPPPHYAQRLDWVEGHAMPRLRRPTLTCSTVDTSGPSCYIRVLACTTPTWISTHPTLTCTILYLPLSPYILVEHPLP